MTALAPAKETIARRLHEAAERNNAEHIEFWAAALDHLTRPIPEYVSFDGLTRHLLLHREPAADPALEHRAKAVREH